MLLDCFSFIYVYIILTEKGDLLVVPCVVRTVPERNREEKKANAGGNAKGYEWSNERIEQTAQPYIHSRQSSKSRHSRRTRRETHGTTTISLIVVFAFKSRSLYHFREILPRGAITITLEGKKKTKQKKQKKIRAQEENERKEMMKR